MQKHRIIFVHEGKAAYPEIAAYKTYFGPHIAVDEMSFDRAKADRGLDTAICWQIMGLYPRRLAAKIVIHDYRSLSVGFAAKIKDRVKSLINHKPDLRVFQNDGIRSAMALDDGIPFVFLPMGVPPSMIDHRSIAQATRLGDYCYIGSMLPERRIDGMIASFLQRYGASKSLWLFGSADDRLQAAFKGHANIVFAGMLSQDELFARLPRFGACVCYFPNHHPHVLQTPTKLLEYAALGLRIIANEHPQSRSSERQYGIACLWGPADDMFADAPDMIDWADNATLDPSPMLWPKVIEQSGVDAAIQRLLQQ